MMSAALPFARPARARGFTIIEMMIAITLSLLIALVITRIYLSGLGSQRAQTDQTQVQESLRSAFDVLGSAIRKAGYKNPDRTVQGANPGGNFCKVAPIQSRLVAVNDPATIDPASATLAGSGVTIVNASDALKVRYYGSSALATPATADGTMVDCLGNPVAAATLAEDSFFVAADSQNNNEPTLFCRSSNSAASGSVALVPGIESMQILFGEEANTAAQNTVSRYVEAGTAGLDFSRVRNVVISLIARTPNPGNAVDTSAQTILHFGSDFNAAGTGTNDGRFFTTPTDGRIRQHVMRTLALRNLCPPT